MSSITQSRPQDIQDASLEATDLLSSIRKYVQQDLRAVDDLIINQLFSDVMLIQQITRHIIASGGKRLRPLLVILSARAVGYNNGIEHHELAAIIEFVHTATLLHDDVVDESKLRRGRKTANALWGNQASVLVGDFLYSRAFQMLTRRSNVPIMQVLARTTNSIAEGEILQLMNCNDPDITEKAYFDVIHRKTAKLFESSAQIGAMLSNNSTCHDTMAQYGLNLGMAFQVIDDLLDYTASQEVMGKNVGDDLAEGKATLPLIYAMANGSEKQKTTIKQAIEHGGLDDFGTIMQAIHDTDACHYCFKKAQQFANQALAALQNLPQSVYRSALIDLVQFAIHRNY